MGAERSRSGAKIKNMEDISVPPGFVSLTSFTLKMVDNSEESHCPSSKFEAEKNQLDASPHPVDIAKLKRSLGHRPWILPNQLDDFPMESDSTFDAVIYLAPLSKRIPSKIH